MTDYPTNKSISHKKGSFCIVLSNSVIAIDVFVEYIEVPDRPGIFVIAMHFDGWVWGMKPSTFHGCPYIRIESTTSVMPPEIYEERLRECRPMEYAWENLTTLDATLDDIDENRVMGIVRAGIREGRMPETALEETSASLLNRWGTGIKRMIDVCKAHNLPEPFYQIWADGTIVLTFQRPKAAKNGEEFGYDRTNCST